MFFDLLSVEQQNRINKRLIYSGIDSPDNCYDSKWFKKFTNKIYYNFNNWGFRDIDQTNIANKFIIIGDSFTVGLGQTYEETWAVKLENLLGENIIKLAVDGASNQWMSLVYDRLPDIKHCFIMISFVARYTEIHDNYVVHKHTSFESPEILYDKTKNLIKKFSNYSVSAVPNFDFSVNQFPKDNFIKYERLVNGTSLKELKNRNDLARDGFHFGNQTSTEIAENFYSNFKKNYRK